MLTRSIEATKKRNNKKNKVILPKIMFFEHQKAMISLKRDQLIRAKQIMRGFKFLRMLVIKEIISLLTLVFKNQGPIMLNLLLMKLG